MAASQRALTPTLPPGSAGCGSSVSSVRLYRDQRSILSIEFNYKDGDSSASGDVTELYDELVLESSECLVRIVQYMDLNETDGDGSGHKRRVELTTSSGRTFQTTAVDLPTPDAAPLVLQAPPSMCITDALLNTDAGWANALTEVFFSACKEDSGTPAPPAFWNTTGATWGSSLYRHCLLNFTMLDMTRSMQSATPIAFKTGGLGHLLVEDVYEAWVCVAHHACSDPMSEVRLP